MPSRSLLQTDAQDLNDSDLVIPAMDPDAPPIATVDDESEQEIVIPTLAPTPLIAPLAVAPRTAQRARRGLGRCRNPSVFRRVGGVDWMEHRSARRSGTSRRRPATGGGGIGGAASAITPRSGPG